jgi:hypothetical protein
MIGTFHVVCVYFKMIGKKMEGTGLSDILLETGLIGSGSVTCVITGKHSAANPKLCRLSKMSCARVLSEFGIGINIG